jgi:sortase A
VPATVVQETPAQPAATAPAASPPATEPGVVPPEQSEPNRLVIPAIDLNTPLVDVGWEVVERGDRRYTEWQTADNAAGRHLNSARPGEQGNVVLSGHHNTKGEVFRRISEQELAAGDMIYLYDTQGQRYTYQVTEVTEPLLEVGASEAQRLANARYIQPTSDARVTLVTCWPYWTNTHRIVVVGTLVP